MLYINPQMVGTCLGLTQYIPTISHVVHHKSYLSILAPRSRTAGLFLGPYLLGHRGKDVILF